MTGREALLQTFDRLFDKAAAKLHIDCNAEEKEDAKRQFVESFSPALDAVGQVVVPEVPADVLRSMEDSIDQFSAPQIVGYLAAIPLLRQAHAMARTIASRAAEQRLLDHLIAQADDTYGGN